MDRILGTVLAGLVGLAFGSFLNVCLTRWPAGESVVSPPSHCRNCARRLAAWENLPLLSWIALRGRCRTCGSWIGWRYPLVEAAVAALWATVAWRFFTTVLPSLDPFAQFFRATLANNLGEAIGAAVFFWLLVALAVLDAEHLWLPNRITYPGIVLGFVARNLYRILDDRYSEFPSADRAALAMQMITDSLLGIFAAAGIILLVRWVYRVVRKREGMGLGDAKLMAMLSAWLGFSGALLALVVGVLLGAGVGIVLAMQARERGAETAGAMKLPLGTFLCAGAIVSGLWGEPIIAAYLHWAGFR
ncbi:MAG TPA: prepilin peptidase [Terracidiphilus sp.]|nr:prepilin peptidase [Terracidiphilus sp.]